MTFAEALRAAAHYVEEHKAAHTWGDHGAPLGEDQARLVAEVSAFGHELDSLAAASETARVYRREVATVVSELQRRGFTLPPEIEQAIDDAFNELATTPKAVRTKRPALELDGRAVAERPPAA